MKEEKSWSRWNLKCCQWRELPISEFFKKRTTHLPALADFLLVDLCKLPAFGGL